MAMQDSGYTQVSVEDLLDYEGVEYRATSGSRGPQFNVKTCPTCGGDSWKVYLSRDTGYGNCFHGSCGASFNLWTFAKALLDTADSRIVGVKFDEIAKLGGWRPKRREKKVSVEPIIGAIKMPTSIPIPDANIPYLADRGVSVETARQFALRMCYDGSWRYKDEAGADKSRPFSGRILIPIFDLDGSLATFQGRDVSGLLDPKYLFPSRLPSTARYIYNGQRAAAERWSHLILGEGAFDCIAIQTAIDGDHTLRGMGAGGSFGKKLTLDYDPGQTTQLQALQKLREFGLHTITIMWDGEKKAFQSAVRDAGRLTNLGFNARIALLPPGKDPAEVSAEVVRMSIRLAVPYSRNLEVRSKLRSPYK